MGTRLAAPRCWPDPSKGGPGPARGWLEEAPTCPGTGGAAWQGTGEQRQGIDRPRGQHRGRVLLVPGPGACLARPGLPRSRGKPRQPSPSLLPLLVTPVVSSFVLRASSQLGSPSDCGGDTHPMWTYASAHTGARLTLAGRNTRPSPHTGRSRQIRASPQALPVRRVFVKKDRPPLGQPALPRHKGTAFSPHPEGRVSQGLLLWWEDREKAPEPQGQGQRPQNSAPTHRWDQTPSPLASRHLPGHSGAQEFLGDWIKIRPPPIMGPGPGDLDPRQVWGAVCPRRVEPLSSLNGPLCRRLQQGPRLGRSPTPAGSTQTFQARPITGSERGP